MKTPPHGYSSVWPRTPLAPPRTPSSMWGICSLGLGVLIKWGKVTSSPSQVGPALDGHSLPPTAPRQRCSLTRSLEGPPGSSWPQGRKEPQKQNRKLPALSVAGAWVSLTCHQPAQPASAHCPHRPPPGCTCASLLIPEPQAHIPWFGRDGLLAELAPTSALGCCPACQHPNPTCPRPPGHLHLLCPPLGCLSCAHPDGSQLSLVPCLPSHSPPPAGERTPPRQGPAPGLRPALWP